MPAAGEGTSTVTYGSVSEFIDINRQSRGYALIYTLASASSVAGPFIFGLIADVQGLNFALVILALITSITFFTCFVLRR